MHSFIYICIYLSFYLFHSIIYLFIIYLPIHSLIYLSIYLFYSIRYLFIIYLPIHSLIYLSIYLFIHYLLTYSFIHLFIYLFNHLFFYLFIHSFICLFIYLFNYLLIYCSSATEGLVSVANYSNLLNQNQFVGNRRSRRWPISPTSVRSIIYRRRRDLLLPRSRVPAPIQRTRLSLYLVVYKGGIPARSRLG